MTLIFDSIQGFKRNGRIQTRSGLAMGFNDFIFMQYTGFKDKNGVGIFEGDIVRIGRDIHKVTWSEINQQIIPWLQGSGTEIIGNIYENPELLAERI